MGSNLLKRGNTWFVRVAVPRSLQGAVGRREVQRTTGTTDIRTAERRKHAIIAAIKNEIDELAGPQNDPRSPAWVTASVRAIRKSVQRGEMAEDVAHWIVGEIQDKHLAALGTHRDDPNVPEQVISRLRSAARVVSDPEHVPLFELIETYLSDRKPKIAASTLDMKRRELEAFANWLDSDPRSLRGDPARYRSLCLRGTGHERPV